MRKIFSGRRPSDRGDFVFTVAPNLTATGSTPALDFQLPITAPTSGGLVAFEIDWGDGTVEDVNSTSLPIIHTYAGVGTYTCRIRGALRGWAFGAMTFGHDDACKMKTITNWGCFNVTNQASFRDMVNFVACTANDIPLFEYALGGVQMWRGCTVMSAINNLDNWNVGQQGSLTSGVTNMAEMFRDCGKWNSSNSTIPTQPNLTTWDVKKVTNFGSMFSGCTNFNGLMFKLQTGFVKGCQTDFMYYNAQNFNNALNSNINNWDTQAVTSMSGMFYNACDFNQPIGSWDVSAVGSMQRMFAHSGPPSPSLFNQPIGSWDVSNVTAAWGMFFNASSFDQNLSNWDLSSITGNPTNGTWDTPAGGTFQLSQANYNALLIGWDAYNYPSVTSGTWNFGTSTFDCSPSAADTAHVSLVTKWGGISDGGCT